MNLQDTAQHIAQIQSFKRTPPLEQWHPPFCGNIDLTITANGQWWYEGKRMTRQNLIDLFASVLWREGDDYFLKTPVEKIGIHVEDVPLFIEDVNLVDLDDGQYIECVTTHQDRFVLDQNHAITLQLYQGQWQPYVHVRFGLQARILRHAFYHMIQWCNLFEKNEQTVLLIPMGSSHQTLTLATAAF